MSVTKAQLLKRPVEHIDIKCMDVRPLIDSMDKMAFQARNLARGADIFNAMVKEKGCGIILCLAGSLISAGLKQVVIDLLDHNMVDAIVSTGANIVDQDFFEALGFQHYQGSSLLDDEQLQSLMIDRIYDTLIDEDNLRVCDHTIANIADRLEKRPHSSREFIYAMGAYLAEHHADANSIVLSAHQKDVPIFVPAFSDCSAGFGLVMHQVNNPGAHVSIDSVKDFRELTQLKIKANDTGLFMIGGGVPKNFAQDVVVAAELLGQEAPLHKYAVQITVADERDGGLSGSTLREACSWGKVAVVHEQMVYAEATLAMPLIAGFAYHEGHWQERQANHYNAWLDQNA